MKYLKNPYAIILLLLYKRVLILLTLEVIKNNKSDESY